MTSTVQHGTSSRYVNHHCRCQPCRDAFCSYVKARRLARRSQLREVGGVMVTTAKVQHGTIATYSNWSCRCSPCAESSVEYQRAYRASTGAVSS